MSVKPIFAWYDLWVGAFWDRRVRRLYLFPIPCLGLVVQFKKPDFIEVYRGVTYYPNDHTGKSSVRNTLIEIHTPEPSTAYVRRIGCEPSDLKMKY
jgi:hypothetical protein